MLSFEQLESLCRRIVAIGPYASMVIDSEGLHRVSPVGDLGLSRRLQESGVASELMSSLQEMRSTESQVRELTKGLCVSLVRVIHSQDLVAFWILAAEVIDDRFWGAIEIQKELALNAYRLAVESELRHKQSGRLAEANSMLQLVLDAIPVRVFWKDIELNYLGANRLFVEDSGLPSVEDLVGKSDNDLVWSTEAESYRADDLKVIESRQPRVGYEESQTTPTGETLWLRTNKIPLTNAQGKMIGVLGTYSDITLRKQIEEERERLLKDLEGKNAELERFAYTASHDLKSPLVTIRGFLGMLSQDIENGKTQSIHYCLEQIDHASSQMIGLLEDLLEMARVGRIANPPTTVCLQELVGNSAALCEALIRERGVELKIDNTLPTVLVDGPRIVQVFQNLIENSCKYMGDQPRPQIDIKSPANSEAVISFADNGIGIEPRYHDRVFGVFDKLDQTSEGSGIGLALVKRIVEVHDGRIWIESDGEGSGTTFYINLPTAD